VQTGQPYKYEGKELEKSFGLEMYDFDARMVDPQLGRTWQLDPHADLYPHISPFASMNNSPPNYVDPNGKDVRVGMQRDDKGNTTITLSSTIYVKGYRDEEMVGQYNQFLKDNAGLLSNTSKNEDGTTTTTNIDMKYELATDEDVARVTNGETRNGDNLIFLGNDEGRSSASGKWNSETDPITGETTKVHNTSFTARLGNSEKNGNTYGSPITAFHEGMHLFGLRDWYRQYTDVKQVGTNDIMVNSTPSNTKPIMSQMHWNNWGKQAQEEKQRTGQNNSILNRFVEEP
jgi:RHS repeat-associated protein